MMKKVLILLLLAFALVESRLRVRVPIESHLEKEYGERCYASEDCRTDCCTYDGSNDMWRYCGYKSNTPHFCLRFEGYV